MKALALLLLVVGGLEQSYGPYRRPFLGGTHATCAARGNILLAWSEEDQAGLARIHVVLLDSTGAAISPISVLPALNPSRDAIAPAIGTDGSSFLVVWEESLGMQQTVAMAVDARGVPAGDPQRVTMDVPILTNEYEHARVHWVGGSYVVLTGTKIAMRLAADGSSLGPVAGVPAAVGKDGTFASADVLTVRTWCGWWSGPIACTTNYVRWTVGALVVSQVASAPGTPYVTATRNAFLVTWASRSGQVSTLHYRFTNELPTVQHMLPVDVDSSTRVRADCTQTRCIVVYATRRGDVEGFVLDPSRPELPPGKFTVTATERVELEPEIVMITANQGLVSWRSSSPFGEWLAGRTLYLAAPKQRAVR